MDNLLSCLLYTKHNPKCLLPCGNFRCGYQFIYRSSKDIKNLLSHTCMFFFCHLHFSHSVCWNKWKSCPPLHPIDVTDSANLKSPYLHVLMITNLQLQKCVHVTLSLLV